MDEFHRTYDTDESADDPFWKSKRVPHVRSIGHPVWMKTALARGCSVLELEKGSATEAYRTLDTAENSVSPRMFRSGTQTEFLIGGLSDAIYGRKKR